MSRRKQQSTAKCTNKQQQTNEPATAPRTQTRNPLAIPMLQKYPPNNAENSINSNKMLPLENASQRCPLGFAAFYLVLPGVRRIHGDPRLCCGTPVEVGIRTCFTNRCGCTSSFGKSFTTLTDGTELNLHAETHSHEHANN